MLLGPCSVYTVFALFSVLMLGRGWLMWTGRGILSSWLFNSSMMDVCPLGVLTCDTKIFILHAHSHVSIHMTTPDFPVFSLPFFFFLDFIYLFLESREGREKERERNINVWLPLVHPLLGTWVATQACALLGIKLVTLWFLGQHSIH